MRISLLLISNLVIFNLLSMYQPVEEEIKISVSSLAKAEIYLCFAPDANIQDLKARIATDMQIPIERQRIYLLQKKFKLFTTKTHAAEDIQKLKDIIEYHKTNKFLVCIAKEKKKPSN